MTCAAVAVVNRVAYLVDDHAHHVERMVDAVARQVREHFAPQWGLLAPDVFLPSEQAAIPHGAAVVYLVPRIDDTPAAAGRHLVEAERGYVGYVAVDAIQQMGGALCNGADSVSSALSHEVLELLVNPAVNRWADAGDGREIALEVCDPVSGDAYEIDGCSVSNFVLPAWFDPTSRPGARLDHMGLVGSPFAHRDGGYVSERDRGRERVELGAAVPSHVGERLLREGRRARAKKARSVVASTDRA